MALLWLHIGVFNSSFINHNMLEFNIALLKFKATQHDGDNNIL